MITLGIGHIRVFKMRFTARGGSRATTPMAGVAIVSKESDHYVGY